MPTLTIIYGEETHTIQAPKGALLGDIIAQTELPLEQPCAGRGTCGKCKILNEGGLAPPDEIEHQHLTDGEIAVGNRLACRARIESDGRIALACQDMTDKFRRFILGVGNQLVSRNANRVVRGRCRPIGHSFLRHCRKDQGKKHDQDRYPHKFYIQQGRVVIN